MGLWPRVRAQLSELVNRHVDAPEWHQLFSLKLTPARQKTWDMQKNAHGQSSAWRDDPTVIQEAPTRSKVPPDIEGVAMWKDANV